MSVNANPAPLLSVRNLQVARGGARVLDIPTLDVARGKVLALFGPNGVGKSTLLLSLASLIPVARGEMEFEGKRVGRELSLRDFRRHLAMVFQEPLLLNQSVYDNVALGLSLHGTMRSEIKPRVMQWLERLDIAHLAERSARTLSGGEAQRTSLARALALKPDLLLLDEPFAALDALTRMQLRHDFRALQRELAMTTVLVTHDLGEAYLLADHLAVLDRGHILQFDTPERVFRAPTSLRVAQMMGVKNILAARVISPSCVRIGAREFETPTTGYGIGARVFACIRPERITLVRAERERPSLQNVIEGALIDEQSDGTNVMLQFRADGARLVTHDPYDLEIDVPTYVYERLELATKRHWTVAIKTSEIHLVAGEESKT